MKDNFIPSFMEILIEEPFDENQENCWVEIESYGAKPKVRTKILTLDNSLKCKWKIPKIISHYYYDGILMEIESDTCMLFFKPSSIVFVENEKEAVKAKDLKKKQFLKKKYLSQRIELLSKGLWKGYMYSLFFDEPCFLPIRFNEDYCLIPV